MVSTLEVVSLRYSTKKSDFLLRKLLQAKIVKLFYLKQVLAATQTPGEAGKKWFQGTADAVRKFLWVFEVIF